MNTKLSIMSFEFASNEVNNMKKRIFLSHSTNVTQTSNFPHDLMNGKRESSQESRTKKRRLEKSALWLFVLISHRSHRSRGCRYDEQEYKQHFTQQKEVKLRNFINKKCHSRIKLSLPMSKKFSSSWIVGVKTCPIK